MTPQPRRRLSRDVSGVSALEFAIVAPIFLTLLIGVIQLGWGLHCASNVRYAVKTAARALMLNPQMTDAELLVQVKSRLQGPDPERLAMTVERQPLPGGPITVRVRSTYDHPFWAPFVEPFTMHSQGETTVYAAVDPTQSS